MAKKEGKKKHHVGLIILITFLTVFLVIPVGFVFIFIFDTTHKDLNVTSKDFTTLTNEMMGKAFETTGDDGKISMKITEDDINSLIFDMPKDLKIDAYIPQVYCEINDTNYRFYFELQASFFKTRICLDTTIKVDTIDNTDCVVFAINKIAIGRANHLTNILKWVASKTNLINDTMIEGLFNINGKKLNIKSDLANMRVYYPVTDFKNDINTFIGESFGTGDNLFLKIITELFNTDVFSTTFNDGIAMNFELAKLGEIPTDKKPTHAIDMKKNLLKDKVIVKELIDEGKITNDATSTDAVNLFNYLIRGYTYCTDAAKTTANNFKDKLAKHSIQVDSSYIGHIGDVVTDFSKLTKEDLEIIKDPTIIVELITKGDPVPLVSISDKVISNYLKSLGFIGYTTFINSKVNDENVVNFITLDNFNIRITNGKLYVYAGLNINGYETTIILGSSPQKSTAGTKEISFKIDEIYFNGTKFEIDGKLASALLDIIGDKCTSSSGGFKFDTKNKTITMSFDIIYDSDTLKTVRETVEKITAVTFNFGATVDDGKLTLTITKNS